MAPRSRRLRQHQKAAREFARIEFPDHRYVMVLHSHQANPHVHLSVKAESKHGERMDPRKADLHRWRETFAERLREWGIGAEATRQAVRGAVRNYPDLWRKRAAEEGRACAARAERKASDAALATRRTAGQAWATIAAALGASPDPKEKRLALDIERFVTGRALNRPAVKERTRLLQEPQRDIGRSR
ncbi:MAG: relaxase/mobilization nuclease domain-containing protein [Croceibacterium sp.]